MIRLAMLISLLGFGMVMPVLAQTSYTGNTTGGSRFRRPNGGNPPISLASTSGSNGNNVQYHTHTFTPAETTRYRVVSTTQSPTWDNFIALYSGTFNPMSPLTNCLAANDDYGNVTTAGIDAIPLTAGQNYTIVVTAFANAGQGAFETVITPLASDTIATTGGSVFQRPNANGSNPPTTLSGAASAVSYRVLEYMPTETGTYRLVSLSATPGFNNFTVLYKDSFNPASPLTNALIANDNLTNDTLSGFEVALTANTPYFFVTTGSTMDDYGVYTTSIQRIFSQTVSGTTIAASAYHRPNEGAPPTSLSTQGTAVPHTVFIINVTTDGNYNLTVTSQTTGYDPFTALHSGDFDPVTPLGNILRANDDKGGTASSGFDSVPMLAGTDYLLVVTGLNNDDVGTFTLTVSGDHELTVTTYRIVSGIVKREDCPDEAFDALFTFRPPDSSGDVILTVPVTADGKFTIKDLRARNYRLRVKTPKTLARIVSADTTQGYLVNLNVGLLKGGDVNDDNSVDVLDLDLFIQAFDTTPEYPNYNAGADFNCDESVDVLDLDIFLRNFDTPGAEF